MRRGRQMLSWRPSRRRRWSLHIQVMSGSRQTPALTRRTLTFNAIIARLPIILRRLMLEVHRWYDHISSVHSLRKIHQTPGMHIVRRARIIVANIDVQRRRNVPTIGQSWHKSTIVHVMVIRLKVQTSVWLVWKYVVSSVLVRETFLNNRELPVSNELVKRTCRHDLSDQQYLGYLPAPSPL